MVVSDTWKAGQEKASLDIALNPMVSVHWSSFDCVVIPGKIMTLFPGDLRVSVERDGEAE